VLSIAGLLGSRRFVKPIDNARKHKYLILIPSYKEDSVILHTASQATNQDYPKSHYDVLVIADSLKESTIERLKAMQIGVLPVAFDQSTKVKALNKAFGHVKDNYDVAIILDADNIMKPDFLTKFNMQYSQGMGVVQGQRAPKNQGTEVALLDGLSEHINNHIFRKGTCNLGMSSAISGSGFGGDYDLLKTTLATMDSIGGFDKELEIKLIEKGVKTRYYDDIIIYDEKVEKPEVFQNQRKRWISSQYFYLRKYFWKGIFGLAKGDVTYFNSTVLRNLQLPRLINLGLLPIFLLFGLFFGSMHLFPFWAWLGLVGLFIFSVIFALPKAFYGKESLVALSKLPKLFFLMISVLFKLKGANKKFIHTPKGANQSN